MVPYESSSVLSKESSGNHWHYSHRIFNKTIYLYLPVNVIRVEDHNKPVHAEYDRQDDHGHLGDLQKRVEEERMKAAIQIHHILTRINRIKSFNQGEDELEGEVAYIHVGQHYQQVTEPSREKTCKCKALSWDQPARGCSDQHPDGEEVADEAEDDDPEGDGRDHGLQGLNDGPVSDGTPVTVREALQGGLARLLK